METREAPPAHTAAAGGLPEHHREQRHFPQEPSGAPASLHCAAFVRAPPLPSSHGAAPTYLANLTVAAFRGTNPV